MREKWKTIKGYRGLYKVSNRGRVLYIKTNTIKHSYLNRQGYHQITLFKNGVKKSFKLHRLVAQAFIPNPLNKPFINHIDGDKDNNRVCNLEWVTSAENNRHAIEHGLNDCNQRKVAYYENGKLVHLFDSLTQAGKFFGVGRNTIHARINSCKHVAEKLKDKEWKYFTPLSK